MKNPVQHVLYRFFDAHDRLLYVGITGDPESRFHAHSSDKPWWGHVATIKLERFPSRKALAEAEIIAIQSERPKYNRAHSAAFEQAFRPRGRRQPAVSIAPEANMFGTDRVDQQPADWDGYVRLHLACPGCHANTLRKKSDHSADSVNCTACGWTGSYAGLLGLDSPR